MRNRWRERALAIGLALAPVAAPLGGAALLPGCPILALTGIPCPTCGASRAVDHALGANPAFLEFNAPWAVAILAGWLYALSILWRVLHGRAPLGPRSTTAVSFFRRRPQVAVAAALGFAALTWSWAFVNLDTIRPS